MFLSEAVNKSNADFIQNQMERGIKGKMTESEEESSDDQNTIDEIRIKSVFNEDDKREEEKLMTDSASDLPTVDCRFKDEHSTMKRSYEDILQSTMDQTNEKRNENVSSTMNFTTSQGQNAASELTDKTLGKCVSISARRVGVGTKCPNERGETRSSGYTERGNKRRKQDETTDQLTNLPKETQEQHLRDFFTQFGSVRDVFLAKDTDNNTSKHFALIVFTNKEDAQKARECVGEFGNDHLTFKFDWINGPKTE